MPPPIVAVQSAPPSPSRTFVVRGETLRLGAATTPEPERPPEPRLEPERVPLSPLDRLAACFKVAGFPEPFLEARTTITPELQSELEILDTNLLLTRSGSPIRVTVTLSPPATRPAPPLVYTLTSATGSTSTRALPRIPASYLGGVMTLVADHPVLVCRLPAAESPWWSNRADYLLRYVAQVDSPRRIRIERIGVQESALPASPDAITSNPETAEEWQRFLRLIEAGSQRVRPLPTSKGLSPPASSPQTSVE